MAEAFLVCRNCKRNVASARFAVHEVHCLRFLVLCPEREEPVPREKMEEHCKDEHQQANECRERLTECKFCKLDVQLSRLELHESHCGRQTELCLGCGQFTTRRALVEHTHFCWSQQAQLGTGERISAPEREIHCHYCNQMIPENKYFHHMGKCHPDSEIKKHFPVGKPKILPSSLPSQAAENPTSTMEKDVRPKTKSINRFPLHSESSSKKTSRGKSKTLDPLWMSEPKPRTTSPVGDEAAYDILRRCSQCGILLPLPILNQHQEKCWWLASSKGKQVRHLS
ncbi:XIAP-associated factor 1 isoform X2 [Saimiri boliviensis]|uniref:XIAP associated factor 1 n=1 Tax=Saimiri boliviensis boliviensis TaxID=39432 RepID=A0A2K6THQ1_SAIBB